MTFADAAHIPSRPVTALGAKSVRRLRDLRLDFFRGIAMFIILIAHAPGNFLSSWIPARWGFSDATEIFVFCSGMASAIAFGGAFDRMGWRLGTARVGFRVWQVYWAHIGLFMAVATLMAALDIWFDGGGTRYIGSLNLWKFFQEPGPQLVGLMTLTYVPNYFDVLPMYMVVLIMMPLMMAASRVHPGLVAALIIAIWLLAQDALLKPLGLEAWHLALPAEPWSDRTWFFNPFGWQLVFFTGFAFMRGWLPKPPVTPALIALAAAIVLLNIPLSNIGVRAVEREWFGAFDGNPVTDVRLAIAGLTDKSDFGLLRHVHFLGLAYLAWVIAGDGGARLMARGTGALSQVWGGLVAVILKVGQQSLAVFVVSMFTARVMGFVMDFTNRETANVLLINLGGALVLVATAYGAGWFKSHPWRKKADT